MKSSMALFALIFATILAASAAQAKSVDDVASCKASGYALTATYNADSAVLEVEATRDGITQAFGGDNYRTYTRAEALADQSLKDAMSFAKINQAKMASVAWFGIVEDVTDNFGLLKFVDGKGALLATILINGSSVEICR